MSYSDSKMPEGETFPASPASARQAGGHQSPNEILALWGQVSKIASGSRLGENRMAPVQTVNSHTMPHGSHTDNGVNRVDTAKGNPLFNVVEDPLTRSLGGEAAAVASSQSEARAAHIRGLVADCVQALDKLNLALDEERTRHVPPQDEKLDADLAAARRLTAQLFDNLKHWGLYA